MAVGEAWARLAKRASRYSDSEYPKVSVAIPTFNSERSIECTLDSVLGQDYPSLEVIVIDGGSTDRTLRIARKFYGGRVRLYSVTGFNLYEMLNKGVNLAEGEYVNFLYPSDYYLQGDALRDVMALALDHRKPDLVFGGSLIRDNKKESKVLFRPLELEVLRSGKCPTALPSCWFKRTVFDALGPFETSMGMRGNLDFLCRFLKNGELNAVSTSRVYSDHEVRLISQRMIFRHFWETLRVIYGHFGLTAVVSWLFRQRDTVRMLRSWWHSVRLAIFGQ